MNLISFWFSGRGNFIAESAFYSQYIDLLNTFVNGYLNVLMYGLISYAYIFWVSSKGQKACDDYNKALVSHGSLKEYTIKCLYHSLILNTFFLIFFVENTG